MLAVAFSAVDLPRLAHQTTGAAVLGLAALEVRHESEPVVFQTMKVGALFDGVS
jgi:hypothetical protein